MLPSALHSLLVDFEPAIRELAGRLDGVALREAANRQYEFVMAWTPPPHQDEVHERMCDVLVRCGVLDEDHPRLQ
ncbi:MAG: hypothetical protein ACTHKZ_02350 [Lysobacteraceae bacterium]